MGTKQDVIFQGLTHSPSDYDCQDGELATCLNLINEDGALHPIHQPVDAGTGITLGVDNTIEFVHKITSQNGIQKHYIIASGDVYYYMIENSSTLTMILQEFKANSITAVGNVLCFVGDNSIKYAFWKNGHYTILDRSKLQYQIYTKRVSNEPKTLKVEAGDSFWNYFIYTDGTDESTRIIESTSASGIRQMFNDLDAIANKLLSEKGKLYFKRNVIGVAAMRLYDGTYINISCPFILPHADSNSTSKRINIYKNKTTPIAPNGKTIISGVCLNKYNIEVRMSNANSVKDLVQGVDIFLTNGEGFFQLDKTYNVASDPLTNDWVILDDMLESDVHETIGNMPLYHSIFIPVEDFNSFKSLERPVGTEESISLADLNRFDFGGKVATTYNNRLHVAGIQKKIDNSLVNQPIMSNGSTENAVYEIYTNNGTYYLSGTINVAPYIISVPFSDVNIIILYTSTKKQKINLYSPSNYGLSFRVRAVGGNLTNIEADNEVNITSSEWEDILSKAYNFVNSNSSDSYSPSLIKVSEAENPLVFPAKNSVQVGSSIINALAANTRPISEGQFGDAPLYAFTDEGVWVLMLGSEGTYIARQPANRDICSNPKGILQIDDAVLFSTDRGIMMQRGRDSECITDILNGYPFDFTKMYGQKYPIRLLEKNGNNIYDVQYVEFREFLKNAEMIYDYYGSRIIVFNSIYTYAYVYSIKSKMWGTMSSNLRNRVNIYPEAYAINDEDKIVDVHVKNPSLDVKYFICSRPLTLGQENIHKTMFDCIVRGYFRGSEPGKCGVVLFGSNDLFNWYYIGSSINQNLRGLVGSPYKYFRIAIMGSISKDESINGISTAFQPRWQNKLR